MDKPIVWFDLETGGLRWKNPNIQLAAVVTEGEEEVDYFERKILFDPADCDPEALEVNCYDPEVWEAEAIHESVVVEEFSNFLRPFCAVPMISKKGKPYSIARCGGHNVARFDADRLHRLFKDHNAFLPMTIFQPLDTYQRAIWYFEEHPDLPSPENLQLRSLCEYFHIRTFDGAHDALADARMTSELARCLCR
jgi:DNA polymerase III epsilon subunit-like protein